MDEPTENIEMNGGDTLQATTPTHISFMMCILTLKILRIWPFNLLNIIVLTISDTIYRCYIFVKYALLFLLISYCFPGYQHILWIHQLSFNLRYGKFLRLRVVRQWDEFKRFHYLPAVITAAQYA